MLDSKLVHRMDQQLACELENLMGSRLVQALDYL